MAGDLPLVDFIPLLIIILTVVIAVFALYKYMRMEKIRSDLVIGIAFLLLTLAMLVVFMNSITDPSFFPDNGLGGLDLWLQLIAYLVFLITIEPMKVIDHFRK
ncbi:hypothetical protein CEE45_06165 [Candidatus Heimdallarchaeota archaeon B3_Heim]|nr:MAG: hypothetical protein CEE45_06165 [Candidatus Heimdallarchaeota archaeon B3_Heim]